MHSTLAALWKCESGGRNRYPGPTNAATISAQKLSQKKKIFRYRESNPGLLGESEPC